MDEMQMEITKKEAPFFFAALKRALLLSLAAEGLLSHAQAEALSDGDR